MRRIFYNERLDGLRPVRESVVADYVVEFGRDGRPVEPDGRLDAPAFHRNHEPIWAVLAKFLAGKSGDVLEAGSGTGQHVVHFARLTPEITWWPSDFNEAHLKSIGAWLKHAGLPNIRPPLRIDLSDPAWHEAMHDGSGPKDLLAVFCANVIHIAPWRVAEGLFAGSARYLRDDGRLRDDGARWRGRLGGLLAPGQREQGRRGSEGEQEVARRHGAILCLRR